MRLPFTHCLPSRTDVHASAADRSSITPLSSKCHFSAASQAHREQVTLDDWLTDIIRAADPADAEDVLLRVTLALALGGPSRRRGRQRPPRHWDALPPSPLSTVAPCP